MKRQTIDILSQTQLFRDLDDEVLQHIAARAIEKKIARGEFLFLEGEKAFGLYVIAEGSVRAFRTGIDGREQVISRACRDTIAEVVIRRRNLPSSELPRAAGFTHSKGSSGPLHRAPPICRRNKTVASLRKCADL